ncbi:MAG: hypothetical protein JWQ71_949 [Pedosphaera sp.]|nr:hypothetical protein [Pedosphaera sp.]
MGIYLSRQRGAVRSSPTHPTTRTGPKESRFYELWCLEAIKPDKTLVIPVLKELLGDTNKYLAGEAAKIIHKLDPVDAENAGVYKAFPMLRFYDSNSPANTVPYP